MTAAPTDSGSNPRVDSTPRCPGGEACLAKTSWEWAQKNPHWCCPCGCGSTTTMSSKRLKLCQGCGSTGFCVQHKAGLWVCAQCRNRAYRVVTENREAVSQQVSDSYAAEFNARRAQYYPPQVAR